MIEFEFTALLALAVLLSTGSLVSSLRSALPLVREVRAELAVSPILREYRYTITETVAHWNDVTVVALPVRVRNPRPAASHGLRAAA